MNRKQTNEDKPFQTIRFGADVAEGDTVEVVTEMFVLKPFTVVEMEVVEVEWATEPFGGAEFVRVVVEDEDGDRFEETEWLEDVEG